MKRVFADTSYWIALLNPRDALHGIATRHSLSPDTALIVTSEWVLTELLNDGSKRGAIHRKTMVQAADVIRHRNDFHVVSFIEAEFPAALDLFRRRSDKNWSLTDCSSFLIMQKMAISEALTYDLHFEQAGFRALLRD